MRPSNVATLVFKLVPVWGRLLDCVELCSPLGPIVEAMELAPKYTGRILNCHLERDQARTEMLLYLPKIWPGFTWAQMLLSIWRGGSTSLTLRFSTLSVICILRRSWEARDPVGWKTDQLLLREFHSWMLSIVLCHWFSDPLISHCSRAVLRLSWKRETNRYFLKILRLLGLDSLGGQVRRMFMIVGI